MASITLSELKIAGSELFQDSESFLNDLSEVDSISVNGGGYSGGYGFSHGHGGGYGNYGEFGAKYLEYLVDVVGIDKIAYIAKSFSHGGYL